MCFQLSRKTDVEVQRKGLISLGAAFIMVMIGPLIWFGTSLVGDLSDLLENGIRMVAFGVIIAGIYFAYNGFVKPAITIDGNA